MDIEINARNIPTHVKKKVFLLNTFKVPINNISEITGVSLPTISLIIQKFESIYTHIISDIQPRGTVIKMVDCYTFYLEIHDQIRKNTKYRNPSKLTPIAIYFYLRSKNVFVTAKKFIKAANLTRDEFTVEDLLGSRARVKILNVLAINKELTISLLIKKTKLNHVIVSKHLKYLISVDLVQEKLFGRIRIFRFKLEDIVARAFKNFISIVESEL